MANGQYCIVDVTIDPHEPISGLSGLSLEQAESWLLENQIKLETPIPNMYHIDMICEDKYLIQRDNWPESGE